MIQVGSVLIAKDVCMMTRNSSGNALIIGKEYVVYHIDYKHGLVIQSELEEKHFFSLLPKDDAYWGNYFDLKGFVQKKPQKFTDEFLEKKFKGLIYHFGEVNWDIIKTESWDKYINNQESFSEKQFEDLRYFVSDLIEDFSKDLLEQLMKEQQEVISSPIRFNGVHVEKIKQVFDKLGVKYDLNF